MTEASAASEPPVPSRLNTLAVILTGILAPTIFIAGAEWTYASVDLLLNLRSGADFVTALLLTGEKAAAGLRFDLGGHDLDPLLFGSGNKILRLMAAGTLITGLSGWLFVLAYAVRLRPPDALTQIAALLSASSLGFCSAVLLTRALSTDWAGAGLPEATGNALFAGAGVFALAALCVAAAFRPQARRAAYLGRERQRVRVEESSRRRREQEAEKHARRRAEEKERRREREAEEKKRRAERLADEMLNDLAERWRARRKETGDAPGGAAAPLSEEELAALALVTDRRRREAEEKTERAEKDADRAWDTAELIERQARREVRQARSETATARMTGFAAGMAASSWIRGGK